MTNPLAANPKSLMAVSRGMDRDAQAKYIHLERLIEIVLLNSVWRRVTP